jgi:hypothetical protein
MTFFPNDRPNFLNSRLQGPRAGDRGDLVAANRDFHAHSSPSPGAFPLVKLVVRVGIDPTTSRFSGVRSTD